MSNRVIPPDSLHFEWAAPLCYDEARYLKSGRESMADIPRLNGMIKCARRGQARVGRFCPPDVDAALAASQAKYDGVVFEMEHNPWDIRALRDCLQYMLNREQIVEAGSLAPNVTPIVRIPVEWRREKPIPRQAGARYRRLRHRLAAHLDTVEQAYNAVAACRYPRLQDARRATSRPAFAAIGPARRRALLGHQQPGVLQEGRCVAARPERRNPRRS